MGCNLILLTGNPGTGVSNRQIISSLKNIRAQLGDKLILAAGKMHAAGSLKESGENIISKADIKEFINAGADIVLLPAQEQYQG